MGKRPRKWYWKPDYELHLWKMDGEAACAIIIQLKLSFTRPMFWAFGIWKQGWFPEHRTVSSIIFVGCFPTKVSHFLWLKHEKHFLHSAASSAPSIVLVSRNTKMAESKWRESIQLQNDKFCGNYPSRWSLKYLIHLGNTKQELGNVWHGGEHLFSSWTLNQRKLNCKRSGGM